MSAVRRALIGFLIAFGVTAALATVTTIRQVHLASTSVPHPVTRI